MTDLFQYPVAHMVDVAFRSQQLKRREPKRRTVKCGKHPYFTDKTCPYCHKTKPKSPTRSSRQERERKTAIEDAVLAVLLEHTPKTNTELAQLASTHLTEPICASSVSITLQRLVSQGRATLVIPRADGKAPGS